MNVKPRYDLRIFNITPKGYAKLAELKFTTFLEDGSRILTCKGGTDLHKAISQLKEHGELDVEVVRQFNYPGELAAQAREQIQVVKTCPHCGELI